MSRTAAHFVQSDIARAIRAAKQAGAGMVELRSDGTIRIVLVPSTGDKSETPVEDEQDIIL